MFRRIATKTTANTKISNTEGPGLDEERAKALFNLHPAELYSLLEMAWSFRINKNDSIQIGDPRRKTALKSFPKELLKLFDFFGNNQAKFTFPAFSNNLQGTVLWDHLIYAYVIESTQVYKIFQRLIQNYARGDFEINLDAETLQWLHNTEMLWYADPPVYSTFNMVSHLRMDIGSIRRNAYYRMFGFNLPSDNLDGKAYPFHQPKVSNSNFRRNFERFCEEVWVGIVNRKVTIGAIPIDDESIQFNAFEMQKNFLSHRNNGDISKQEFFYVAMMSWFHLTLEFNSPIVKAFGISEQSPAQRLIALANIVGVPANGLSENLFRLADPLSLILTLMETGLFNENARILYDDQNPPGNLLPQTMQKIIFNYSQVSGRDLKVREGQNLASYPLPRGTGVPIAGSGVAVEGNGALTGLK